MRITSQTTDDAALAEVGARLDATRLQRNWTQARLAAEAGIGLRTLKRLEAGEGATLATLVRVLRALDLLGGLEHAVPEPPPSPIEQLRLAGRRRRRASSTPRTPPGEAPPPAGWTWGDEAGS